MDRTLPEQFCQRMQHLLGEEYEDFEKGLEKEPCVTVRFNKQKSNTAFPKTTPIPWCPNGYYLPERPKFVLDPIFHAGGYYVQEASSMFLAHVLKKLLDKPVMGLDLCAAPGGKSTLLLDYLPENSFLIANEVIRSRSWILYENCVKWGHTGNIVSQVDPKVFAQADVQFDFILADVPCSGEGMFRKDPVAISEWSIENIKLCVERGRRILNAAWKALKPGGLLFYSTCTFNIEENEEQLEYLISEYGAEPISIENIPEAWGITGSLKGAIPIYRFLPHKVSGEGLSMGILQKPQEKVKEEKPKKKKKNRDERSLKQKSVPDHCKNWVKNPERFTFLPFGTDKIITIPKEYLPLVSSFLDNPEMKMLKVGICIAELKGRNYAPTQELAMSIDLNPEAFPEWPLEKEQALNYLRREALTPPTSLPKGWIRVTYEGLTLGWVKNIGNRANNLFPQEWKIRTQEKLY